MSDHPTLPPFFRLSRFDEIDSTNDEAKRLAASGAAEGTLVWAGSQNAGRGRRGRPWVSLLGNLHVSLILKPQVPVGEAAEIGFVAALAVAAACDRVLPGAARLKWPNDVLIDDKKVAGILLESRAEAGGALAWLVVGIGVNLAMHPEATEHPATSLQAAGASVTADAMLAALAHEFLGLYDLWRAQGFAPVRTAWLERAHGLGDPIRVRLAAADIDGRFAGLDTRGMLLLDAAEGRRAIAAAEIFPAA